jgi:MinD superfamily P-loop ATPase
MRPVSRRVELARRQIARIDEALCNGCGACVTPCAEGAIVLEGGKARVVDEALCDGAGFCLPICPTGALTVEVREAPAFDEERAEALMHGRESAFIAQRCFRCGTGEEHVALMPVRYQGHSLWVCARCLPALIHG